MTLPPLNWTRLPSGLWETRVIGDYWLGILSTPTGHKFRGQTYPGLTAAQAAAQAFVQTEFDLLTTPDRKAA